MDHRPSKSGPHLDACVLTGLGRSLRPVLLTLATWVNQRLAPGERGMILVDSGTGQEVEPVVAGRVTGRRVDTGAHVFAAGPAASPAMRVRYGRIRSA